MDRPENINLELAAWVVETAQKVSSSAHDFLQAICDGLLGWGVPIDRVHVSFIPRHPQLRVGILQWSRGGPVSWGHVSWPERSGRSPLYRRNPLYLLRERRLDEVRCRLTDEHQLGRYANTRELAREGYTDYLALAAESGFERPNTMACVTRFPDGFSEENLRDIRTVCWAMQGPMQRHMWRSLSKTLCQTYIGNDAGERVFSGEIRRGQLTRLDAVVWFCDLKGFTRLSEESPEEKMVSALNQFFDVVGFAIEENGGEILKLVGDAVLAVFTYETADDEADASCRAIHAGRRCLELLAEVNASRDDKAEAPLRCSIGLHSGEVVYGNIGTETRLDFTIIGRTVNLASRVERLCGPLDVSILFTQAVARHFEGELVHRGTHTVKGIGEPVEVLGLAVEAASTPRHADGSPMVEG